MPDRIGQIFGNYRLTRLLGRGGFAEVYLGQHLRLSSQQAAIKILSTHLEEEHIQAFTREAETIASLVHPQIIRILDFDVAEGVPFLVMDYAPYGSLQQRHRQGEQVPLPAVVSYVQEVAEGLQYAHDRKIIHRDIKPANMLIGARNEILLSDFGVATIAHSTNSQSTQATSGTITYMAPEQIQGLPRPTSDQYALGISVYQWLAGERPFVGSFTEVAVQHAMVAPPSLRDKLPTIPPAVEQVVMTALEKDPRRRFSCVSAFARALEEASQSSRQFALPELEASNDARSTSYTTIDGRASSDFTSSSRPASSTPDLPVLSPQKIAPVSSTSIFRSIPQKWMLSLALLILLLGGGSYFLFNVIRPGQTSSSAHALNSASSGAHTSPGSAATKGNGASATPSTNPRIPVVSSDATMFGYNPQHTRNPDDTTLTVSNVHSLYLAWSAVTGDVIVNAVAVANGIVYVPSKSGNLYAFDVKTGQRLWFFATGDMIESSPAVVNGIVYIDSDDSYLYALDARTGAKKWSFHTNNYAISSPTVADGVVYFGSGDHNLYALDATSGDRLWAAPAGSDIEAAPAIWNGMVYVGAYDGKIYAFNQTNGKKIWSFTTTDHVFSAVAIVDGIIYVGSNDANLYALDATTGRRIWAEQMNDSVFSSPAVANGLVYVASQDHNLYAFDAATGARRWSFATGGTIFSSPVVANGVIYIASYDQNVYALDAATGKQLWSYATAGKIDASPVIAEGALYIGSNDSKLYAFHLP